MSNTVDNKIAEALKVITDEMLKDKSDGSYYYVWQANIAMAFYDECKRFCIANKKKAISESAFAEVGNNAAKNFLYLLCAQSQMPDDQLKTKKPMNKEAEKLFDDYFKNEPAYIDIEKSMCLELMSMFAKQENIEFLKWFDNSEYQPIYKDNDYTKTFYFKTEQLEDLGSEETIYLTPEELYDQYLKHTTI